MRSRVLGSYGDQPLSKVARLALQKLINDWNGKRAAGEPGYSPNKVHNTVNALRGDVP